jgi:hypothetical protein
MSVENLATLPENVASVLDLVVWVLEAGAGALVQAQGPVAAQVTVPAGMVLLCGHLLDHCKSLLGGHQIFSVFGCRLITPWKALCALCLYRIGCCGNALYKAMHRCVPGNTLLVSLPLKCLLLTSGGLCD